MRMIQLMLLGGSRTPRTVLRGFLGVVYLPHEAIPAQFLTRVGDEIVYVIYCISWSV